MMCNLGHYKMAAFNDKGGENCIITGPGGKIEQQ